MANSNQHHQLIKYALWGVVWALIIGVIAVFSFLYTKQLSHPDMVYGQWIELDAPHYDTDIFTLSNKGVIEDNRIVSTTFEFTGSDIKYYHHNVLHHYQVIDRDKTLIRRVSPAPAGVLFAKRGSAIHNERIIAASEEGSLPKRISLR